jgi:hypothetical protein
MAAGGATYGDWDGCNDFCDNAEGRSTTWATASTPPTTSTTAATTSPRRPSTASRAGIPGTVRSRTTRPATCWPPRAARSSLPRPPRIGVVPGTAARRLVRWCFGRCAQAAGRPTKGADRARVSAMPATLHGCAIDDAQGQRRAGLEIAHLPLPFRRDSRYLWPSSGTSSGHGPTARNGRKIGPVARFLLST